MPKPEPGKTVRGATETGMELKVETFVDPAKDPRLKRIDDVALAAGLPGGGLPPRHRRQRGRAHGRQRTDGALRAPTRRGSPRGQGIEARFSCDALEFEWLPGRDRRTTDAWNALRRDVCGNGPPKPEGIAAGASQTYYLVTDRGFAERGLRRMRVFGPRDAELK